MNAHDLALAAGVAFAAGVLVVWMLIAAQR